MTFHVGQRVVCINDAWFHERHDVTALTLPKLRKTYCFIGYDSTREAGSRSDCAFVFLKGFGTISFASDHFRPVVEKKTDISVFTEILIRESNPRVMATSLNEP